MTNGTTKVIGTSLVDHGLKPTVSLQQPSGTTSNEHPHDSYIITEESVVQEEEKMMDELVTSEDEETSDKIVLAMALVQSVVDHNKKSNSNKNETTGTRTLRKRQRPSGTNNDPDCKKIKEETVTESDQVLDASGGDVAINNPVGDSSSSDLQAQPQGPIPPAPAPIIPTSEAPTSSSIPGISVSTASSAAISINHGKEIDPPPIITLSANSSVPNPLSNSTANTTQQTTKENTTEIALEPSTVSSADVSREISTKPNGFPVTVPCPLPVSTFDDKNREKESESAVDKRQVTISVETQPSQPQSRGRVFSIDLDPSFLDSMVMPQDGSGTASVTDLPMLLGSGSASGGGGRQRAYSFECFAFGINADEPLPPLHDADGNSISTRPRCDSVISARPRGDSVFSARPRGDSIICDAVLSSRPRGDSIISRPRGDSITSRPRGDSIIFDPVSFQDGGIHEKTATMLAKPRTRGLSIDIDEAGIAIISSNDDIDNDVDLHLSATVEGDTNTENQSGDTAPGLTTQLPSPVPAPVSSSAPTSTTGEPPASSSTLNMTTLPSGINGTITTTATGATTTFSMELLNKDGRIGIYLPDARKARIARFHAKRKMRIWRKRIKYDCRKKLADSRPRIKGRFVKRSDMGDD